MFHLEKILQQLESVIITRTPLNSSLSKAYKKHFPLGPVYVALASRQN